MTVDRETVNTGRKRLTQVFRYLESLNQLRNPAKRQIDEQLWVLWFRDLPIHPAVQRGVLTAAQNGADASQGLSGDDFVLKVHRPRLTGAPLPPAKIRDWLRSGWDDPMSSLAVQETRNETDAQSKTIVRRFEDDPERPELFKAWQSQRDLWVENEKPAREALKTFERLYELYGAIRREEERVELVVGDGILNWRRPEGGIHHPILLQRVELHFNPEKPEFTVSETDQNTELYSALFRSMLDVDGKKIGECRDELDRGQYHPLESKGTSGFLRRLVQTLSPHGQFLGEGEPKGESDHPRIGRDPVLFLRTRTLGFATALEGILRDLESREKLPSSLLKIVGIESPPSQEVQAEPDWTTDGNEDEQVLFSKPANPEQLQLARRLDRHGSVLVQGPPGTGKTHTIANLLGHLLAAGNRVLVTSHTTKALRMVREQVVRELQPLCVSVLENDAVSRDQLKSSIEGIVEKGSMDVDRLEQEAIRVDRRRKEILVRLRDTKQKVLEARRNEYRDIVVGGEALSPSDAAREVASGLGLHDWIPGGAPLGASLPLAAGEVLDLYRTNTSVLPDDELELSTTLPSPEAFLSPFEFERLLEDRRALEEQDFRLREDLWDSPPADSANVEDLESLLQRLTVAMEGLQQGGWRLAATAAGRLGKPHRDPWDDLVALIKAVHDEAGRAEAMLVQHGPRPAPDMPLDGQLRIVEEILGYLDAGGRLTRWALLIHGEWKALLPRLRVGTAQPSKLEHFHAVRLSIRLRMARQDLVARWERQVTPLGGPSAKELGIRPEAACLQYCGLITDALDWDRAVWRDLEAELTKHGFRWKECLAEVPPNHAPHGDLLRVREAILKVLPEVVAARIRLIRLHQIETVLADLARRLDLVAEGTHRARVVTDLRAAVAHADSAAYRRSFTRLVELWNRKGVLDVRRQLLIKLEPVAPGWASAIRDRVPPHDQAEPPGESTAAWRWKQLHDELECRNKTSLDALMTDVTELSSRLGKATAELIDKRAWAAQIHRTDLERRQALNGWLKIVQKIGKGTGKRVPLLQAEARRLMDKCQAAVPVWVMPLARVVENFDPRLTRFDVVVIDEASQSDVMSLIALYMADRVVVVGDDEQVSPEAVGLELIGVQNLIDEHLRGIPNHMLYDGKCSIYDLAFTAFGGTICLREHFRCVPEIIQFSNHLSYNGGIKPLRDASHVVLKPHVIAHRVESAKSEGKVNEREALAVASLLIAASEQPEYAKNDQGKPVTFGVISLVGEDQARCIETLLREHLPPTEYERRRIICGNAAHFQGDERDVIFLSVVDAPRSGPLPLRAEPLFKKRFNVAASRGRDQVWVVHSLNTQSDLKPEDLRRRLIEHAQNPHALSRLLEEQMRKVDQRSLQFEGEVLRRLVDAGYSVIPQLSVGYYRIDLVVEGDGKRLAVECDGDRFHPLDKLPEDMARQAILERLGWTFVRIRGSVFFREADRAMQPVFERLAQMGIRPEGRAQAQAGSTVIDPELRHRIIRRSEELLREWGYQADESSDGSIHADKPTGSASNAATDSPPVTPVELASPVCRPFGKGPVSPKIDDSKSSFNSDETKPSSRTVSPETPSGQQTQSTAVPRPAQTPTVARHGSQLNDRGGADANRVLNELRGIAEQYQDPACLKCRRAARLAISNEGIVVKCGECGNVERVATAVLQEVADRVLATCYACDGADLKSTVGPLGNYLKCQKCGRNNSWQGVSDRIRRK